MRNLHFRLWTADGEPIERRWILPFVFAPDYFDHTQKLLEELCALDDANPRDQAKAAALAHEIVLEHWVTAELQPSRPALIDHRIEKLHDILVTSEQLRGRYDSEKLAKACHLSISQMNRLFKSTFQCSPQKYWNQSRLSAICMMLKTNCDVLIVNIALEFGFENPAYFSRWFKKFTGQTPKAYRAAVASGAEC